MTMLRNMVLATAVLAVTLGLFYSFISSISGTYGVVPDGTSSFMGSSAQFGNFSISQTMSQGTELGSALQAITTSTSFVDLLGALKAGAIGIVKTAIAYAILPIQLISAIVLDYNLPAYLATLITIIITVTFGFIMIYLYTGNEI